MSDMLLKEKAQRSAGRAVAAPAGLLLLSVFMLAACSGGGSEASTPLPAPPPPPPFSVIANGPAFADESGILELYSVVSNAASPVTYHWTQTSGPEALIRNGDSDVANVQIPLLSTASNFAFQVTAFDASGASSTATVNLTAEPAAPSQVLEIETIHDGLDRIYSVYTPANLPADAPLVIFLHGANGNMRSFIAEGQTPRRWFDIAEEAGIMVAVPNGFNPRDGDGLGDVQTWNELLVFFSGADDVGFILQLVDEVSAGRPIDPAKVFVGGRSNGGNMALRLAIEAPERFRGFAPFLSSLPSGDNPAPSSLPTPPMFIYNDTNDPLVAFEPTPITRGALATLDFFVETTWSDTLADPAYVMLEDTVADDGCQIFARDWADSTGMPTVRYFEGRGGGHNIPDPDLQLPPAEGAVRGPVCRDLNGVDAAWDFFESILDGAMVSPGQ